MRAEGMTWFGSKNQRLSHNAPQIHQRLMKTLGKAVLIASTARQ